MQRRKTARCAVREYRRCLALPALAFLAGLGAVAGGCGAASSPGADTSPGDAASDGALEVPADDANDDAAFGPDVPIDQPVDDQAADAPPATDGAIADGAIADGAGAADERNLIGLPLPPGVAPPVRVLGADGQLVTFDDRSCTHQDPIAAGADRWCAFTTAGISADVLDLWVVDATVVAATGAAPPCDGSDPRCLRLSRSLAPTAGAFFEGDTLIYHADQQPGAGGDFLGRIYGWRPGWSVGRPLSSARGILCFGQLHSAAAGCLDDPVGDPANRDAVNIRVGDLTDPSDQPLPALAAPWALRNDNLSPWQAGFSPDGQTFAFSNVDASGGPVSLKTVMTAAAGGAAPLPLFNDLVRWTLSNDGQKIYFYRGQADSPSLYVADFPSAANAQLIADNVTNFTLIGDRPGDQAVGVIQKPPGGDHSFLLLRDRTVAALPAATFSYSDGLEALRVSADLRYTLWLDSNFLARLVTNDGATVCNLNLDGEPAIAYPNLSAGGNLLIWLQSVADVPHRWDGFVAPSASCRDKQRFAQALDFALPIEDRGLIFGDESDPIAETVTLKYVALTADGSGLAADGPYRIATGVKSPVIRIGTNPLLLLYRTAETGERPAGTWVFGPVPF